MKRTTAPLVVLTLIFLAGCGSDGPSLVKVSGTITLNGSKPFEGAQVDFMPDKSNREATLGSDVTGPNGNYMIRSASGRTGLTPGKYTVKVAKAAAQASATGAADDAPTPQNDPGQQSAAAAAAAGPKKKAADPAEGATGSFTAEVPAGGIKDLDFDVKSK
jgi:hypothetical protein